MSDHSHAHHGPAPSYWPIVGSIALFFIAFGIVNWLQNQSLGPFSFLLGTFILSYMIYGWFRDVIAENKGHDDAQLNSAFRWAVFWFIFTELMFFGSFFGALFYARMFSVPWLGGEGHGAMTHLLLWPDFQGVWPALASPDTSQYATAKAALDPWGVPALNTLALMLSDVTITWAYWSLLMNRKHQMIIGFFMTLLLSIAFIMLQIHEYGIAYTQKGILMSSGIYGATFFMLTGVHATHVLVGIVMVLTLIYRGFRNEFSPENSFAVGAISWYWHFIDVLWLALFVFVYWV